MCRHEAGAAAGMIFVFDRIVSQRVTAINMILNFVTDYLFDTFVVFRGSIDTNDAAKKETGK